MANRHFLLGIISIIFAVGVILFFSRSIFGSSSNYIDDADFNQIGNLVYNNPGMKKDTWYLVYDLPGQSAVYKELDFDSASACAVNAPAAPCNPSKLEAGVRVRVEGRITGDSILVRTVQLPEYASSEDILLSGTSTVATGSPATSSTTKTGTSTGTSSKGTTSTGGTSTKSTSTGTGTSTVASSTGTSTTQLTPENGLTVKLYYYNPSLDQGSGGAECTTKGLVAVQRIIPRTNTPLQDTIKLLLRGELSSAERSRGLTTEFPLSGVTLLSASSNDGVLTLMFRDSKNRTSGGSCRAAIMWNEIEATAKQFPGVDTVKFLPETLFQP